MAWPVPLKCNNCLLWHAAVETDADIETMFDDISYGKGASVLRMLRAALLPPSSLLCRRAGLALHMAATRAQYATLT